MLDVAYENLKKTTEMSLRMQQEMFKKWASLWPCTVPGTIPGQVPGPEDVQQIQKKWMEFYEEILKKQRETFETQFRTGLKHVEDAFRLAETKDPVELRTMTIELWRKVFETLQKFCEGQLRDFQALASRWTELVMAKG